MRKLIQVSLVLVVALALIIGLFQVADGNSLAGSGGASCRVGWNTRNGACYVAVTHHQGPDFKPYVGWNS